MADQGREEPDQAPGRDRESSSQSDGRSTRRESAPKPRPTLTERQRREAREARRRRGRTAGRKARPKGNPLVAGIRATGRELARAFAFLGGLLVAGLAALAPVGGAIAELFRQAGLALGWLARVAGRLLATVGAGIGRLVDRVDRVVTPARAIVAVSVASAVLLGWSQFIDYRAVEIGQPGYAGVLGVVSAPTTDGRTPIDEHSFLLVAVALTALVATFFGGLGRRQAGFVIAGAGLLSVAVALLIDLPAGTDASVVAAAYSGAEPVLLAGFWLELAAGVVLACCGALIAVAPAPTPRRATRRRPHRRPAAAEEST